MIFQKQNERRETVKRRIKNTVVALLTGILLICTICACSINETIENIEYIELGIPTAIRYPEGIRARCPWDMAVQNGNLYIGSGDYDANAGPVDMWCYHIEKGIFSNTGTLPEEEIGRFCRIGGKLIAPGIDATEDWLYGNYYTLEGEVWQKTRNIPGGLHNFDMVEYKGKIFCGLGVASGEYPIACSSDGGRTFAPVAMYRDGIPLDTSGSQNVRVYDLFLLRDSLYAAFMYGDTEITYDLYRYDDGKFVYDNQWYQKIHQIQYTNTIIGDKAELNGKMFFTTGYLYATSDMTNFSRLVFPEEQIVYDLEIYENSLYVLCGKKQENGQYRVSVWKNAGEEDANFFELFNFLYDVPPLSIACHDGIFYIGMGDSTSTHSKNGMILSIKYLSR